MVKAREAAAAFVRSLGPEDRAGLIGIPGASPLVDLTRDKERVASALENPIAPAGEEMSGGILRVRVSVAEAEQIGLRDGIALAAAISRECDLDVQPDQAFRIAEYGGGCPREVLVEAQRTEMLSRDEAVRNVRTLRGIVESLGTLDVPKRIVLVSSGFRGGHELTGELEALAGAAAAARVTIDAIQPSAPRFEMSDRRPAPDWVAESRVLADGPGRVAELTGGALLRTLGEPGAGLRAARPRALRLLPPRARAARLRPRRPAARDRGEGRPAGRHGARACAVRHRSRPAEAGARGGRARAPRFAARGRRDPGRSRHVRPARRRRSARCDRGARGRTERARRGGHPGLRANRRERARRRERRAGAGGGRWPGRAGAGLADVRGRGRRLLAPPRGGGRAWPAGRPRAPRARPARRGERPPRERPAPGRPGRAARPPDPTLPDHNHRPGRRTSGDRRHGRHGRRAGRDVRGSGHGGRPGARPRGGGGHARGRPSHGRCPGSARAARRRRVRPAGERRRYRRRQPTVPVRAEAAGFTSGHVRLAGQGQGARPGADAEGGRLRRRLRAPARRGHRTRGLPAARVLGGRPAGRAPPRLRRPHGPSARPPGGSLIATWRRWRAGRSGTARSGSNAC